MPKYNVKKTDGSTLVKLNEKEINKNYSLDLVGYVDSVQKTDKSGSNFHSAEVINSNFIKLLENSASEEAPTNPIVGQMWYKPSTSVVWIWGGG